MSQVDVLRGVWIIQQLSVTWIDQVDAELHNLLQRTLRDHIRERVLQETSQTCLHLIYTVCLLCKLYIVIF